MYPNIKAEMARKGMTIVDLSNATGIRYQTLVAKLHGDYSFTVTEAMLVKNAIGVEIPLEILFEKLEKV